MHTIALLILCAVSHQPTGEVQAAGIAGYAAMKPATRLPFRGVEVEVKVEKKTPAPPSPLPEEKEQRKTVSPKKQPLPQLPQQCDINGNCYPQHVPEKNLHLYSLPQPQPGVTYRRGLFGRWRRIQ